MINFQAVEDVVRETLGIRARSTRRAQPIYPPKLQAVQRVRVTLAQGGECFGYRAGRRAVVLAGEHRPEAEAEAIAQRIAADVTYLRVCMALNLEGLGRIDAAPPPTETVDNPVDNRTRPGRRAWAPE